MATADEYAAWIVANKAKKGTPEFDTVARAYEMARGESAPTKPQRSAGEALARQVGLGARIGVEGLGAAAGAFIDPVVSAVGGAVRMATGSDYQPKTLAGLGQSAANAIGLPAPENDTERVVQAVGRAAMGGAGGAAMAGQLANVASGTTRTVAQQMAAQPRLQAASGGAAGGAGQLVENAGGGEGAQLAASLAAGFAVPGAASTASRIAGARIAPEQQAILDAGKRAGVPVMTSDVLPPKTFMTKQVQAIGERIPVAGTGGARQTQQEARELSVSDLVEKYGVPSYEAIVSSVRNKSNSIKRAAGRVIDQTGEKLDSAGPITPARSVQAIDDAIAQLSRQNVYSPGVAKQLQDLADLKTVLSGGQQTYSTLRQSRTAVREIIDSVDAAGRSQMPSYAKRLVTDVYGAMKNDMNDFASANLTAAQVAKLNKANLVYGNEANLLRNSRLKSVLDKGEMTPEVVLNMIKSGKPSENRILYDSLGTAGRANVRAALIDDAANSAMALRSGEINPTAFGAAMAKHDKKLDIFFKGEERDIVKGMVRLMQATRRGQDAGYGATTTGATGVPMALGASAMADLGATLAGAITAGRLARLYESAPVRDLLLKMANSTPGSRAETQYLGALVAAMRESAADQAIVPATPGAGIKIGQDEEAPPTQIAMQQTP